MSPFAPPHPCAERGCPALVHGKPRCPAHMSAYWKRKQDARPAGLTKFYQSTAWKRLRAVKRAQDPLCEMCKAEGRVTPVEQVDHIERVVDRPDLALVLENLRSLCFSHHSRRTMQDMNRDGITRRRS
jgi:5-methylcytosine-specific restriction protein A